MLWTADPSKFLKYFCSTVSGAWQELDAIRIAPLKSTAFSEWQLDGEMSLGVQALAIGGTDKAI